jgi:hypothetical protein
MTHEYQYEVTHEMQRKSVKEYFFTMVLRRRWIIVLILILFSGAAILSDDGWFRNYGYLLAGISFILIVSWVKSYHAHIKMADTQFEMLDDGMITIELGDKGLRYHSANGDKYFAWEKLNGVKESKSCIYLMRGKTPMVTILKQTIDPAGLALLRSLHSDSIK